MSYILDALQRADAERQRGAVPGLNAQTQGRPSSPAAQRRTPLGGWAGALMGALLLLAGGMGWWLARVPTPEASPGASDALARAPVLSQAAPQPQPDSPTAQTVAKTATNAAPFTAPANSVSPVLVPAKPAAARPKPVASAPVAVAAVAAISAPVVASRPKEKQSAAPAVPLLSELPEDVRRQMAPLAISGAVYSDNPRQRMLIINKQVVTQGGQAEAEVMLEDIGPNSSVFSFRGNRFRLAH